MKSIYVSIQLICNWRRKYDLIPTSKSVFDQILNHRHTWVIKSFVAISIIFFYVLFSKVLLPHTLNNIQEAIIKTALYIAFLSRSFYWTLKVVYRLRPLSVSWRFISDPPPWISQAFRKIGKLLLSGIF